MKVTELLEARKEKPLDDRRVAPGARVKRIIKTIIGDNRPKGWEILQGVSQPKKNGDAIVNIEARMPGRAPADISKLAGDDDEMAARIRAKIASRGDKKAYSIPDEKKEFMITLFKRVKQDLGGLKEVGYMAGDVRKYTYIPADEFDPEKLIKDWNGDVRFKFAFSSDVHGAAFDMKTEVPRAAQELIKLASEDSELKDLRMTYHNQYISVLAPQKWIEDYLEQEYGDRTISNHPGKFEASQAYARQFWTKHRKKLKELFVQTKSPIRLTIGPAQRWNTGMTIEFRKPTAVALGKDL